MILIFSLCIISGGLSRDILFSNEASTNSLSNLKQLIRRLEKPEVVFKKKELPALFKEIIPLLSEIGDVVVASEVEKEVADIPVEFIFFFEKPKEKSKLESISSMAKSSIRPIQNMRSRPIRTFRCCVTELKKNESLIYSGCIATRKMKLAMSVHCQAGGTICLFPYRTICLPSVW